MISADANVLVDEKISVTILESDPNFYGGRVGQRVDNYVKLHSLHQRGLYPLAG